jgi:hypothetical protein
MKPLSEQIHDVAEAIRQAVVSGSDDDPRPCGMTLDQWAAEVAALETLEKTANKAGLDWKRWGKLLVATEARIEALAKALKNPKVRPVLCNCGFHGFEEWLAHNPSCPYRAALAAEGNLMDAPPGVRGECIAAEERPTHGGPPMTLGEVMDQEEKP